MKLCSLIVVRSVELTNVCENIFHVVIDVYSAVFSSGFGSFERYLTADNNEPLTL
jgi:hypothetical protein